MNHNYSNAGDKFTPPSGATLLGSATNDYDVTQSLVAAPSQTVWITDMTMTDKTLDLDNRKLRYVLNRPLA